MNAPSPRALYTPSAALAAVVLVAIALFPRLLTAADEALHVPPVATQSTTAAPVRSGVATVLQINGAIGPATSRYVTRGLDAAQASGSRVVVLQIDTPGGLDTAMRDIIRAILASTIPVVSYVSPPGARAASAGTYILYASHVAAMAPATNLGAATPVSIGGGESPSPAPTPTSAPATEPAPDRSPEGTEKPTHDGPSRDQPTDDSHGTPDRTDRRRRNANAASPMGPDSAIPRPEPVASTSAMERKVVNDAVAYIRGLAELRGRNADWAEQAVRGAASLSATAALKQNVIDVVARDLPDLLSQIDGREVKVGNGAVKLATRDLSVAYMKPDWRIELLSVITNPTVAYGLLLIGIYGLLFEGYNPGAVFPGVTGAVSLLIALFAFQILSVNYAGLALVGLGVGMIVAEFFFPAFGSLGLGGLIAFVIGSLILFDTDIPGMNIGLPVIAAVATVGGLALLATAYLASRSLRRPVVTGVQAMLGQNAEVFEDFSGAGRIRYGSEIWNALSGTALQAGQIVRITKVDGLTVWVEPVRSNAGT
jgi:membrane-bound serine protease (ClpP class)